MKSCFDGGSREKLLGWLNRQEVNTELGPCAEGLIISPTQWPQDRLGHIGETTLFTHGLHGTSLRAGFCRECCFIFLAS